MKIKLYGKNGIGKFALVDAEDFEMLNKFRWHLLKVGYPAYREKGRRIDYKEYVLMHRLIMNTPEKMLTDHINMNKLDNRRANLRVCTKAENMRNKLKTKSNISGYKGVSWVKERKKWTAHIMKDYKGFNLGYFEDKIEAVKAYNNKAKELFGDFAKLNIIKTKICL